jgi:hypothetical protein
LMAVVAMAVTVVEATLSTQRQCGLQLA